MQDGKHIFRKSCGAENDGAEDAGYEFSDPQDFSEYSQLIRDGFATKRHHDEFYLRLIWHFIERTLSDAGPEKWVMTALADAFLKVVMGGRWEDEFPLPWTKASLPFSRAEWSALGIYCDTANALAANSKLKVTDAIKSAASKHSVSYEKARAAYYNHKKRFSKIPRQT